MVERGLVVPLAVDGHAIEPSAAVVLEICHDSGRVLDRPGHTRPLGRLHQFAERVVLERGPPLFRYRRAVGRLHRCRQRGLDTLPGDGRVVAGETAAVRAEQGRQSAARVVRVAFVVRRVPRVVRGGGARDATLGTVQAVDSPVRRSARERLHACTHDSAEFVVVPHGAWRYRWRRKRCRLHRERRGDRRAAGRGGRCDRRARRARGVRRRLDDAIPNPLARGLAAERVVRKARHPPRSVGDLSWHAKRFVPHNRLDMASRVRQPSGITGRGPIPSTRRPRTHIGAGHRGGCHVPVGVVGGREAERAIAGEPHYGADCIGGAVHCTRTAERRSLRAVRRRRRAVVVLLVPVRNGVRDRVRASSWLLRRRSRPPNP